MLLCFLQPNQISRDVACWHDEWPRLQHRFRPDECHRGMTSVEAKNSLTEHLRATLLCWIDCKQLYSFFLALVLLTHGLLVHRKLFYFWGVQHLISSSILSVLSQHHISHWDEKQNLSFSLSHLQWKDKSVMQRQRDLNNLSQKGKTLHQSTPADICSHFNVFHF